MPSIISSFSRSEHKLQWVRWYFQKKLGRKIFGKSFDKYSLYNMNGLLLLLDKTSTVDFHLLKKGEWEKAQLEIMLASFRKFKDTDSVFLDVGSYFGLYGLLARKIGVPDVHFIEPDQRNNSQLHAQLFLNELSSTVSVHNVAISNFEGDLYFLHSEYVKNGNRGSTGISSFETEGSYIVKCTTLDSLLGYTGRTILIKIDVEGNETNVLEGMRELAKYNQIFMQVESFDGEKERFFSKAESMGLRHVGSIVPDHYVTNFDDKDLEWFYTISANKCI